MAVKDTTLPIWNATALAVGLFFLSFFVTRQPLRAEGGVLRLEFRPVEGGRTLTTDGSNPGPVAHDLRLTRLDWLVSELTLQRADGSWLEGRDWYGAMSVGAGRLQVDADGVPAGDYRAIRFRVGVNATVDAADPVLWPAGHALNPEVNQMHWGWQGGYVFLAAEGHRVSRPLEGFSYHLAKAAEPIFVELPVTFRGGGPVTISVELDAGKLLADIELGRDENSTHSREGDALAVRLKHQTAASFAVAKVSYDLLQPIAKNSDTAPIPADTQAYRLEVTQRFPQVLLPADNPLTVEGVALGDRLFHDPQLSINSSQSCASCHRRESAFSDPRGLSVGAEGHLGTRHSLPLFNLAWHREMFWDGHAKDLRDQVLHPIQDPREMHETLDSVVAKLEADTTYPAEFTRVFGTSGVNPERLAKAIEQFLLTLISQDSRFDRAARKLDTMTEEEKRGLQLFLTENDPARGLRGGDCFHCHGGTLFTDHQFHNNGLTLTAADTGRMAVTGNEADRGKFKVPSLRNIAVTGPYMHDGRFATLEEVVEHYDHGVQRSATLDPNLAKHPPDGLQLSPGDKRDLVAFLKTLTDEKFIHLAPASPSPPSPPALAILIKKTPHP